MAEKSLQERIVQYLRAQPGVWVSGDEIERKSQSAGYKASTGSRRARELHEDGVIARKEVNGTVFYCYQPESTTAPPKVEYEYYFDEERKTMVERVKSPV